MALGKQDFLVFVEFCAKEPPHKKSRNTQFKTHKPAFNVKSTTKPANYVLTVPKENFL